MRNRVLCATIAALSVSAGVLSPVTATADEKTAKISISNITDFHGRFAPKDVNVRGTDTRDDKKSIPGAERLKCAIDTEAESFGDAHILTSSGDNIGAGPFEAMLLDDAPTIDALNEMGLEVSAVGNHEFDKGAKDFSERVIPDAKFPYLAANAKSVAGTDDHFIKEMDGVKVAFIGTVTDNMQNLVAADGIKGITWNDPVETTNALAKKLKDSGEADVVVALVHEGGYTPDQFKNVDVAFLGHTHTVITQDAKTTPIVLQAGQYSQGFANVDLSIDRATKKVTVEEAKVVEGAPLLDCTDKKYPKLEGIAKTAKAEAEVEGKRVVTSISSDFARGVNADADASENRGVESTLSNLLAEAAKWSIEANSTVKPDIGVMNAGGVRDDLDSGEVTFAEAFSVQPFGNENTYMTLKGKDFKEALEQQWQPGQKHPILALGLSNNVSYTYNPDAEQGKHILSVTIDGKPLDPEKDYIVAGSTFLLGGSDGFEAFKKGTNVENIGLVDVEAFVQYLKNNPDVKPRGQAAVGVKMEQLKAGAEHSIDLSSLIYTEGNPAKKVTVKLENAKGKELASTESDIDPDFGEKGLGEAGKASVKLAVPAKVPADAVLRITTDKGTDVTMPVKIEGGQEGGQEGSSGSSNDGSSAKPVLIGLGVTGLLAALAGVIVAFVPQFAPVRDQINAALKDFGIQI